MLLMGFKRPHIWPVNKYAFSDEDYELAAVIAGTPNVNIRTSATSVPSLIQEFIPPSSVDLK